MKLESSPFDSSFFEIKIGRLTPPLAEDLGLAAARAAGYAVLFIRLADDDAGNAILERAGHAPVDTLVTSTLDRTRVPAFAPCEVAITQHARLDGADADAVAAITAASIATSHLHYDPKLPIERTRALYAAWGRNDVTGRAQHVIVARIADEIVGYVAALGTEATAVIDLIAVAPSHHGRGIGSALIGAFVAWAGHRVATVGTQSDNPALALYGRCGFVPTSRHFTYHLWLDA